MIQLELSCPKCAKPLCFLLPSDNRFDLLCPHCATEFGKTTPASGFIYALRNESMPGLLKIGFTTRSVEERVAELDSSTATPTPFEIAFYFACSEPQSDEALAHETLTQHRINQNREFFKITETEALYLLKEKLSRQEVFSNEKLRVESYKQDAKFKNFDDGLKSKVNLLRKDWASTAGASKGISLLYSLMSERCYPAAKQVVDLFLADNPEHLVALKLRDQIDAALMKIDD